MAGAQARTFPVPAQGKRVGRAPAKWEGVIVMRDEGGPCAAANLGPSPPSVPHREPRRPRPRPHRFMFHFFPWCCMEPTIPPPSSVARAFPYPHSI